MHAGWSISSAPRKWRKPEHTQHYSGQNCKKQSKASGVTEATWEQVCLPTRLGGLGISDPVVVQPAARLAALLNLQQKGTE